MSLPSGSMMPSADRLNSFEHGRFVLSNLAAKRATQLKEGATPLVRVGSSHPLTIALAEIAEGKVRAIVNADEVEVLVVSDALEPRVGEPGMLLPSLDEVEGDLGAITILGEADVDTEDEVEDEPAGASLSDLLDDEAEADVEVVAPEGEEETVSLHDLEPEAEADDDGVEE